MSSADPNQTANEAIVVDTGVEARLSIQAVAAPQPAPGEALIDVRATSLNLGEVRGALTGARHGHRPGWDLAGVVAQAAADGSGPPRGSRVVGFLPSGAWAQQVAVPTHAIAPLPDDVSFAQAATLPVAGLTALYALDISGHLLGRNVLVDGASGGVGHLAVQMARQGGARVVASVRRPEREAIVREAGAHEVVVGEDLRDAPAFGPYDVILESIGGTPLAQALTLLGPEGICVNYGNSSGRETTFDISPVFGIGGVRLYGFILFHELHRWPAAQGLARLVDLVQRGALVAPIEHEAPWSDFVPTVHALWNREIAGKAVIHVD